MASEKARKLVKIILPLIFGIVALFLLVIFSIQTTPSGSPADKRDWQRINDVSFIGKDQIIYYAENNSRYLQSSTTPTSIGEFTVPIDPAGNPYSWIDNTSDDQKFCVWVKLETTNTYFISSHCGHKEVNRRPLSLDDCCELSKP